MSANKKSVEIKCPYPDCRHPNTVWATLDSIRPAVILCEPETGGCDRYFVAKVKWRPVVTVYKMADAGDEAETMADALV